MTAGMSYGSHARSRLAIDGLLQACQFLIMYAERACTSMSMTFHLEEDRAESRALCKILYNSNIVNFLHVVGVRFEWVAVDPSNEDVGSYSCDKWFLTRESWCLLLCLDKYGRLHMPSVLRTWIPFRHAELYWDAKQQAISISFRYSRRAVVDAFIDYLVSFADNTLNHVPMNSPPYGEGLARPFLAIRDGRVAETEEVATRPQLHRRWTSDPSGNAFSEPLLRPSSAGATV